MKLNNRGWGILSFLLGLLAIMIILFIVVGEIRSLY
jgi:hypothetical protein